MTEVIILANSKKKGNRCIAGIDIETNKWVRPCFGDGEEGIPWHVRRINNNEPAILDIVEIPLKTTGPNRDLQPENSYLGSGAWIKTGRAKIKDIAKYCVKGNVLFYNIQDRVPVDYLRSLPTSKKESLTLIKAHVIFSTGASITGSKQIRATFKYGLQGYTLVVTDCEFRKGIESHSKKETDCILTISLGIPYEKDDCCYKLVAGVIEL